MRQPKDGRLTRIGNRLKRMLKTDNRGQKTDASVPGGAQGSRQRDQGLPLSSTFADMRVNNPDVSAPDAQSMSPIHDALWFKAYTNLREDKDRVKYVEAYEQLVSERFVKQSAMEAPFPRVDQPLPANEDQMKEIIKESLKKVEKYKTALERTDNVLGIVKSLKSILDTPLRNIPQTSLPWAVVSSTLDSDNIKRDTPLETLRSDLRERILEFYQSILFYQMKSVCFYHRSQFMVLARGLAGLDDWDGDLQNVMAAERTLQIDSIQYEQMRKKISDQESKNREEYGRCLRNIRGADPRAQIKGIQEQEELIEDLYSWVLETREYQQFVQWEQPDTPAILTIKGGAGTGKTRLLLGVIKEIENQGLSEAEPPVILYFFCQRTDDRANNGVAVLRSLIWLLLLQQPQLLRYIQSLDFQSGEKFATEKHAFTNLRDILEEMLADSSLGRIVLVLDAMDECEDATRKQLFAFLSHAAQASPRIKWLVSGRPHSFQDIACSSHSVIDFDSCDRSRFINLYIKRKIAHLQAALGVREIKFKGAYMKRVEAELQMKASNTFIWVSLVCNKLLTMCEKNQFYEPVCNEIIRNVPGELQELYTFLLNRLDSQVDTEQMSKWCKHVLAVAMLARRPLALPEIELLADLPENAAMPVVQECQSFLAIRNETVYFIHQSAQDYLVEHSMSLYTGAKYGLQKISHIQQRFHHQIFRMCLKGMQEALKQDIYNLGRPGALTHEIEKPDPDPLRTVAYACQYWIYHLAQNEVEETNIRDVFQLLHKNFLHWLEALSLLSIFPASIGLLEQLRSLPETQKNSGLCEFLYDAKRFILKHLSIAVQAPLQLYSSALIFTPEESIVRRRFEDSIPTWILRPPKVEREWGALLQTLEHRNSVDCIAFSSDSQLVISGSYDRTVKVWDTSTGALQKSLNHGEPVYAIALSPNDRLLASGSKDRVRLWDTETWATIQTLDHQGHSEPLDLVFSPNGQHLFARAKDSKVTIWKKCATEWSQTWAHTPCHPLSEASFNSNSESITLSFANRNTVIWNMKENSFQTSTVPLGLEASDNPSIFSPDRLLFASLEDSTTVKIRNTATWDVECRINSSHIRSMSISPDNNTVALAIKDSAVELWGIKSTLLQQTFKTRSLMLNTVRFSPNSQFLACGLFGKIGLWDATSQAKTDEPPEGHSDSVWVVKISPDGSQVATAGVDEVVKLWDLRTGSPKRKLLGLSHMVTKAAFSSNSKLLVAAAYMNVEIAVWNVEDGHLIQKFKPSQSGEDDGIEFSRDNRMVFLRGEHGVQSWDVEAGFHVPGDSTNDLHLHEMQTAVSPIDSRIGFDDEWVSIGGEKVLWLAPDYRPNSWAARNNTIVIGPESGHVYFLWFDLNNDLFRKTETGPQASESL
ncbi:hypothetical protein N8T08_001166 [Aspergillus melleus]|uniref:Uncharacterized protein n=1 Tax=Aspergillus melleus TaxID=138277 RepID=A0ACC3ANY8_9EURO|nr:hypothetical protein N8T08_001166 [Aspergillus melleus]